MHVSAEFGNAACGSLRRRPNRSPARASPLRALRAAQSSGSSSASLLYKRLPKVWLSNVINSFHKKEKEGERIDIFFSLVKRRSIISHYSYVEAGFNNQEFGNVSSRGRTLHNSEKRILVVLRDFWSSVPEVLLKADLMISYYFDDPKSQWRSPE